MHFAMEDKEKNHQSMPEENGTDQLIDQQEGSEASPQAEDATTGKPENEDAGLSELEKLKEEMEALKNNNTELKDKYIRLFAEFDNYKKRTIREKVDLMNTAARDTMTALLPVLDDFDRLNKIDLDASTAESFSEGVRLVYNKLNRVLSQQGLEVMQTDGEAFDPELHEAFTEVPAPSEEMKGHVVDTIEKGYKLKDKIIRHAKVVVGK